MDPTTLIILGMTLIAGAFSMIRAHRKVAASRARNSIDEAGTEFHSARQTVANQLRGMEVRLLEHTRDLEAQLSTRTTILNELIIEADERIARLQNELAASEQDDKNQGKAA